jgi:DNA-binding GntR family transcriptional regulator
LKIKTTAAPGRGGARAAARAPGKTATGAGSASFSPLQLDLARRLGSEIISGAMPAGMRLTEQSLSARLEVSRTPVRGALRLLAKYKFLESEPNGGYRICADAAGRRLPSIAKLGATAEGLYQTLIEDRARRLLPDAVTEKDLLSRYPVQRNLLSKALVRMAGDGLIEKRDGYGWRFLPSLGTADAISESYRFRLAIECAALLEPTFCVNREVLERTRAAHERFLQLPPQQQKVSEYRELNSLFHEMLARFSGNRFMLHATQQQNQLRRLDEHAEFFKHTRMPQSCREHVEILDAIEQGDQQWAAALLRHHLSVASRRATPDDAA